MDTKPLDASYFDHECCKPFFFQNGRNGVLLIHGFTGCVSHMRPLGDRLAERGYTTLGIALPGHGTTEADMAKADWQQWLQASKEGVLKLRECCDTVTVCGLSMGGVLSLLLAEQMKVDACAPISAPMATNIKLISLAGLIAPLHPRIAWKPNPDRAKDHDPAYDFGYTGFPTKSASDLNHLIHLARRNLFNVQCPLLVVQSHDDHTIWQGSSDCIFESVGSENKRQLWLDGVPHACTVSKELPAIVDGVEQLLKQAAK